MYTETIDFPFLRFLFECRVTGPLLYFTHRRGETIKGLIAREMKKLFPCDIRSSCEKCSIAGNVQDCEYVRFFRFDLCQKPFSYVIVPPLNPRSVYSHNETFQFEIRLFGECARADYLVQYLAPAIEQGGLLSGLGTWYKDTKQHFGRFKLSGIHAWQDNTWTKIFQEEDGFITDNINIQSFHQQYGERDNKCSALAFYTPFCLRKDKQTVTAPTLADIAYFSIMRLRSVTGNRKAMVDDSVLESLEAITPVSAQFEETFSAKHQSYSIGAMAFENGNGAHKESIALLKAGGLCHIGKGATQGYGGYFLAPSQ